MQDCRQQVLFIIVIIFFILEGNPSLCQLGGGGYPDHSISTTYNYMCNVVNLNGSLIRACTQLINITDMHFET